jgi:DNA-binding transcriptional regulator/RsmH inhibitor MraZ
MGEKRNAQRILVGNQKERDLDVGGRIILRWNLER